MLLLATLARASETGIDGHASTGCGACHGASPAPSTTVTLSASATTAMPGDVIDLTLTVATVNASRTAAGLDVAATGGVLVAGSNTQEMGGEITHNRPEALSGGSVVFDFTWTAPAVEGSYTLDGAGNAVNRDGNDSGDAWNLAAPISIVVDDGEDDADGDAFDEYDGDCDDTDARVWPGAPETCDGIDEDCDGLVDEDGACDPPDTGDTGATGGHDTADTAPPPDTGTRDTGTPDTGAPDTGPPDTDTATPDTAARDTGDPAPADTGTPPAARSCGCGTGSPASLALALAGWLAVRPSRAPSRARGRSSRGR